MTNVLLLSTYPISRPRHGGQVRTAAIAEVYRSQGWNIASIAVFEAEVYSPDHFTENDVEFPPSSDYRRFHGRSVPLITDLLSGHFAVADDGGFGEIKGNLPEVLDVIHVEQPWLWPLAVKIKSLALYRNVALVYGSQNIEWPLKKEIFESYGVLDADDVLGEIRALEHMAAIDADLTIAVTQADYDVLESWGCKSLVLAPNGIAPWHATDANLIRWKQRLPDAPWILYVASAHPPNFQGFNESLGGSLACIPPDSRLVVVGSVGEHLARVLSSSRWGSLNMSRLELLYLLSDEDLAAVKTLAHAFLLPIPHGGGSNIKTAEAIFSGKYVVGSEAAFRGFEAYVNSSRISVAKSPDDYYQSIRRILTSDAATSSKDDPDTSALTWDQCLKSIPYTVINLIQKG